MKYYMEGRVGEKKPLTQVKFYYLKKWDTIHMHPYKAHNSVDFCIFTKLYNQHYNIQFQNTSSPWRNVTSINSTSYSSPPQPFAATNLLLISMDLPILDISHIQYSILCIFSFLSCKIHPCHNVSILHSF